MKKLPVSCLLTGLLLALIINVVLAGGTYDYGTLVNNPPVANWVAWRTADVEGGIPQWILTEDNTANGVGENQGYLDLGGGNYYWLIQVENFLTNANGDEVNMIFGGLGSSGGNLYYKSFNWNSSTDPSIDPTLHQPAVDIWGPGSCPVIDVENTPESGNLITFSGQPGTYFIYRSQNPSDANNGASNGRYSYLGSTNIGPQGIASYSDSTGLASWYTVIKAGDSEIELGGCHSESGVPTSVDIADLTATYNPSTNSVDVEWVTVSDASLRVFNVLRSESEHGLQTQLNTEMINVNTIGSITGNTYSFIDDTIERGKTYYYWLEVIELDESKSYNGPVSVTTGYMIYLPLMVR